MLTSASRAVGRLFAGWFRIPLVGRILGGFVLGIVVGLACSRLPPDTAARVAAAAAPFGAVLVAILKMAVFPVIFFSLLTGAAKMPFKRSGRVGLSVIVWYFATSVFATVFGVALALVMNPTIASGTAPTAGGLAEARSFAASAPAAGSISAFLTGLFQNPFAALAEGSFLPVIVYAILFGLAARVLLDSARTLRADAEAVEALLRVCDGAAAVSFKIVDWTMEYFPFGVFALTFANFTKDGLLLFGPYVRIVACVACGILFMLAAIYPLAVFLFCHENPYRAMWRLRQPIITAFATRSSTATLPVSLRTANDLGVDPALSSFSLPLGATVNMDGVCVHLPVFAILAGNLFGIDFTFHQLAVLTVSVVFASVGAGGIPGGSIFLLFMVLSNMGLTAEQVGTVVALALGINPLLDMFETACNVAGDNVCTYIVARRNGLIRPGAHSFPG